MLPAMAVLASTSTFTTMVALRAAQLSDAGHRSLATLALPSASCSSSKRCRLVSSDSPGSSVAASWYSSRAWPGGHSHQHQGEDIAPDQLEKVTLYQVSVW